MMIYNAYIWDNIQLIIEPKLYQYRVNIELDNKFDIVNIVKFTKYLE